MSSSVIHIENGIDAKVSLRKFTAHDLQVATYRNADCYKVAVDRRPKETRSYVLTFYFLVSLLS